MADDGPAVTKPPIQNTGNPASGQNDTKPSNTKPGNTKPSAPNQDVGMNPDKSELSIEDFNPEASACTGLFSRLKRALAPSAEEQALDQQLGNGSADGASVNAPRTRREMIERVIAFDEKRVFDVMIPRADVYAVDVTTSIEDLIRQFSEAGHSRMPVFRDDLDNPQGMVHIKDLVSMIANGKSADGDVAATSAKPLLTDIVRKVLYVPPSMRVVDLFLRMQVSRIHMALVIDEYGGTDGLVTIEDMIEEIVGEINDEHDDEEGSLVRDLKTGGWEANARVELGDLQTVTGVQVGDVEEDIDTLGGLVFALAGRVPLRGEIITHESGLEFEVTDADARKIRKVRIRITSTHKKTMNPPSPYHEPMSN